MLGAPLETDSDGGSDFPNESGQSGKRDEITDEEVQEILESIVSDSPDE